MALELVGGAFLSASLQVLFDRLASSEVWSIIGGQKVSDKLLLELRTKLLVVDKVLDHAEVRQFTDGGVKNWLVTVKNVVYDAEDLLDEIATEALRRKMEDSDSSSSFSTWFKAPRADLQSIESRAKEIMHKLKFLAQAIDMIGLKPGDGEKLPQRSPSTSLVDESCVFGRDEVKEEMIKRLLSDNVSTNRIDLILILWKGCLVQTVAVKAIGSLLYSKVDRREWEETLESEIWDFKIGGILPSLILSYQDLPFHLKRCFAYCSIFPKNHEFNRETLILLWMAEGLLQFSKSNKRMSKVGEQYFDELLSKSFFQKSVFNESWFVMHDLMHDLAQYIFREFCIGFEDDKVQEISVNTRHSSNFISNYDGIVN
ncbi:unnamed protein product, partial [Vitis vinifera]|uniref:Uncharacterized protein n=1 Tax=Vitis vinifera TaxID=29760 RepID=D7TGY3_VITVI